MSRPFSDTYHLRRVAETATKPCFICFKPTSAVLVSEDGKEDFFYTCDTHLKDPNFAAAKDPAYEAAKLKKQQLDAEIELLKKKWEQRGAKRDKVDNKDDKSEDKDDKSKGDNSKDKSRDNSDEATVAALESQKMSQDSILDGPPRIYVLNKAVYNLRLDNWRNVQRAKQTQKMLKNRALFPKVPTHSPGQSDSSKSDIKPDTSSNA
jgi:hypothetical protein